jgi:hypothetical protein
MHINPIPYRRRIEQDEHCQQLFGRALGYPQPVPIVTGVGLDAGQIVAGAGGEPPECGHAAKIVEIMVRGFPNGAKTEELNKRFQEETGLKRQTFQAGR